ncbi:ABC transporter permease [Calditrichota bacterium]
MNLKSTLVIYLKELKDILRDRRTVLSMIVGPILTFPIILILFSQVSVYFAKKVGESASQVIWIDEGNATDLEALFEGNPGITLIDAPKDTTMALELVKEKTVQAIVYIPAGFSDDLENLIHNDSLIAPPQLAVFVDETSEKSKVAGSRISSVFQIWRDALIMETFERRSIRPELMEPFAINRRNIASKSDVARDAASRFLPYVVILMAMSGAMYPAVDLTAGEKERGTLETLLVSGVSRVDIVLGKFLTVLTASLVTIILSLVSLVLTMKYMAGSFVEMTGELSLQIEPSAIIMGLIILIPLTIIFSALLMTIALFAKSYKEAQSYISPLMLVVIFPAMMSMMPGTEAKGKLLLIPIVNATLLMRDALTGLVEMQALMITMGVNFAVSVFCLWLVLRMFRQEKVLFKV